MLLGVAYYPEHWEEERWETDAKLMQEAGITRIRVGEFAWHRFEPRDGVFDFNWLQRAVELFSRYGVKTIMCTPTPTYPAWLHKKHPDIHEVSANGVPREFGMRQDGCKNHVGYRKHANRIVTKIAEHFGRHPDVIAWQTDNEFGGSSSTRCWCVNCEKAFREWLRARFKGDISALNAAWGTFFWSQDYNTFDEISVPRDFGPSPGNNVQNPSLVLDFYRFSSDVQTVFQREQLEILRRLSPGRPITHNLMGAFPHVNYFDFAKDLDFVSWDNYPFKSPQGLPPDSLHCDLMRGVKQKNVWVMEQASGQGGWGHYYATPTPGQMRIWAWQAVARGADMISFFRWRSCRWGREQYWHGLLYHHGNPQWRYQEAKRLGAEFRKISNELEGTSVEAKVGVIFDWDTNWVLETQPNIDTGFAYAETVRHFLGALNRLGVTADVIGTGSDWSRYKILIAPTLHLCPPQTADKLKKFVSDGGTLVLGPRSGVKDAENAIYNEYLPGPLREIAGCRVEDYDNFSKINIEMRVKDAGGALWKASALADVLAAEKDVQILLTYNDHYYAGQPAAIENKYGQGTCAYIGTLPETKCLQGILKKYLAACDIPFIVSLPESVEVVRRVKSDSAYTFYINYSQKPVSMDLHGSGIDMLTDVQKSGTLEIPGLDLLILKAGR